MKLPKYPHCAIICGQTGCEKTEFVLDLLEENYTDISVQIVIFCSTIRWNKTYTICECIGDVKEPKTKKKSYKC